MSTILSHPLALGVDLGGTKIHLVLADQEGQAVAQVVQPTEAKKGLTGVMGNLLTGLYRVMKEAIEKESVGTQTVGKLTPDLDFGEIPDQASLQTLKEILAQQGREVRGIGLVVAGVLSEERTVIHESPNLGLVEVPLRDLLAENSGLPVWMENDTNAAALGEYWYGAGKGQDPMVYMGLGTGVGGGLIIRGELYRGSHGGAGEIGHLVLEPQGPPCGQGHPGCLEAMVSGTALARAAQAAVDQGKGERLLQLAGGCRDKVAGPVVGQALAMGDQTARELVHQAGAYLGMGIASVINLLNPGLIVIGGGLAAGLWQPLLDAAWPEIELRAFPSLKEKVQIVPAGLGEDSAALGAAGIVHHQFE